MRLQCERAGTSVGNRSISLILTLITHLYIQAVKAIECVLLVAITSYLFVSHAEQIEAAVLYSELNSPE